MGFRTQELNDVDGILAALVNQAHDKPGREKAQHNLEVFRSLRAEVVRLNEDREKSRQRLLTEAEGPHGKH